MAEGFVKALYPDDYEVFSGGTVPSESYPFFPGGKTYIHKSFQDPSEFQGTKEEMLGQVRKVRNEIRDWIEKTFDPRIKKK